MSALIVSIRLWITYAALSAGTALLFHAMSNINADGEPIASPIYAHGNIFFNIFPSAAAAYYLYAARNFPIISEIFGVFILIWDFEIYKNYTEKTFDCFYWHQGDLNCETFTAFLFLLTFASYIFAFFALLIALYRLWTKQPVTKGHLAIGAIVSACLMVVVLAISISI